LGILKLGRVLRINKFIAFMPYDSELKAGLKLLYILLFFAIYIHCYTCIWWILVSKTKEWVPYKDMGAEDIY
jgi:hypothetical protein